MEEAKPRLGRSLRVTCTGFANAVRATAGSCKAVIIKARGVNLGVAGTGHAANTDSVIMFIGEDGVNSASHSGYELNAGEAITLSIADVGMLRFRGAVGDSVNILILA